MSPAAAFHGGGMRITGTLVFHAETETEVEAVREVAAWVGFMRQKGFNVDDVEVEVRANPVHEVEP